MKKFARGLVCSAMTLLGWATAQAASYTIDGPYSRAPVVANWYTADGLYSGPSAAAQAPVTGIVDATLEINLAPPGKRLLYGPGSAVAIGSHTTQLDLKGFGDVVVARLKATLSDLTLTPNGSVLLDYADGRLLGGTPVDIGMAMGTPTLTYQITSPQGDPMVAGSANLWRYSPSVLVGSQLVDSFARDDSFLDQTWWLGLSIPGIGFSDSSGTHAGTLEFVISPQWVATLSAPVPEPAALALWLAGLLAVGAATAVRARRSDR